MRALLPRGNLLVAIAYDFPKQWWLLNSKNLGLKVNKLTLWAGVWLKILKLLLSTCNSLICQLQKLFNLLCNCKCNSFICQLQNSLICFVTVNVILSYVSSKNSLICFVTFSKIRPDVRYRHFRWAEISDLNTCPQQVRPKHSEVLDARNLKRTVNNLQRKTCLLSELLAKNKRKKKQW